VRETFRDVFEPSVRPLSNRYVWYGTPRLFDALTLTFREDAAGAFVAHHYRHGPAASTFIVECDAVTWTRAGLGALSEDESRRYCQRVFAPDLAGQPLLTNRSTWISFAMLACRRWSHGRTVLIGDALRTVHFSIGSGTRNALEDAMALFRAFEAHGGDVPAALRAFEQARRPGVEKFLAVAERSAAWYEGFADKLTMQPMPFAHDYLMRGGRITLERLRERSPAFAAAWEAWRASRPA
jgi:2-polyprenyl-6-methoxyphenol hydroxylase-like FAD-dependent oxidoreductase